MYRVGNIPDDPAQLPKFLREELARLAFALGGAVPFVMLNKTNVAPTKPRDGIVSYADGVNWNPGGGAGPYIYQGSTWTGMTAATGGGGTVSSVSVATANGYTGSVANPTTTPAITISNPSVAFATANEMNRFYGAF